MKSSNIGGQAVLEGIMMRHGDDYAVENRMERFLYRRKNITV